ncbi:LuxR C-terminal-related transcriptional regulator [Streptomyces sp. NPDC056716]|uniref:LuxR C-terminal-related transcriptional regulator n=1 Tax=Streptomyces sp. NPDC056716 TaxID=3345922 RepID=UPI0036C3A6BD
MARTAATPTEGPTQEPTDQPTDGTLDEPADSATPRPATPRPAAPDPQPRPRLPDALLWAALAAPAAGTELLGLNEPRPLWQRLAGAVVLGVAVAVSRRAPLTAFALSAGLSLTAAPALFTLSYAPALAVLALLLGLRADRIRPAALCFAAVGCAGTVRIGLFGVDPAPEWLVLMCTLLFCCDSPWLAGRRARAAQLSPREREVLGLVGQGLSNPEIATRLHLVEGTVRAYVSAVLERLGVRNRVQAAIVAYEAGLVGDGDGRWGIAAWPARCDSASTAVERWGIGGAGRARDAGVVTWSGRTVTRTAVRGRRGALPG